MDRLVVVAEDLCALEQGGHWSFGTLAEVAELVPRKSPLLVGVVPLETAVVPGSDRTVDALATARFGTRFTFRTEPLETHRFQAFAISDELFERLRKLSNNVRVVPYAVAVRAVLEAAPEPEKGLRKLTRVLGIGDSPAPLPQAPTERVFIDLVQDDFLVTVFRGREVLEVRRFRDADPIAELQRTFRAHRVEAPTIYSTDHDLVMELAAAGYQAVLVKAPDPFIGAGALERAADELRFLSTQEILADRTRKQRRTAAGAVLVSVCVAGACVLFAGYHFVALGRAQSRALALQSEHALAQQKVSELYISRYPAMARRHSLSLNDELFDIVLSLPPQVELVGLEKSAEALTLVVERRPGAAPFSRGDLEASLTALPYFGNVQIHEEYDSHVIRYHLRQGRTPPLVPQVLQVDLGAAPEEEVHL